MFLITNNPLVEQEIKKINVVYLDTDYMGILKLARDYIHQNHCLITHPLYGSVKPNETLYRSIILDVVEDLDMDSLRLIEEAIQTTNKFLKNRSIRNWPDRVINDFRVLDLDIIENTIDRIL